MNHLCLMLFATLTLNGCDLLPPPAHSALYPPDEAELQQRFIITHDRYHPWQFQPLNADLR